MENYLRSLVTAGDEVYIVMGSYGTGGTGANGSANTVASGNVNVPSNIWKVAVVIPNGNNDLSRVTASTRVIAVNTPNNNSINSDWTQYKCTVRSIESATGYNLLSALPQSVQDAVETKVDNQINLNGSNINRLKYMHQCITLTYLTINYNLISLWLY